MTESTSTSGGCSSMCGSDVIVDLNVGGVLYTTTVSTLTSDANSHLARMFSTMTLKASSEGGSHVNTTTAAGNNSTSVDHVVHNGRVFIDRDGILFRYVLDYLRSGRRQLLLPDSFQERARLICEANFYQLPDMVKCITDNGGGTSRGDPHAVPGVNGVAPILRPIGPGGCKGSYEAGCVTVGYRGTFAFGRDGAGTSDVKFRKLLRILVAGRVSICKEVFQDTLNESRDPDRGDNDRYTARFFLKHVFLEQAFDALNDAHFRLVGSCGSGTNSAQVGDTKGAPGIDTEENKWLHYNEYVFARP